MATLKGSTIASTYDLLLKRHETYVQGGTNIELMTDTSGATAPTGLYLESGATTDNVGIGVSDPDELLELYKVGTQLKLSGGAADYATFAVAADGALTITTVDVDAAEADIILAPDGNVGIGTDAPDSTLQVNKTSAAALTEPFEISNNASGAGTDVGMAFTNGGAGHLARITAIDAGSYKGQLVFEAADNATLGTATKEIMRLDGDSGDVTFVGDLIMADGKGIDFAAYTDGSIAGSTTSQILKDYEEGTFTPAFSSTGAVFDDTTQSGYYTKVGRLVTFTIFLYNSGAATGDTSNQVSISGLPYTAAAIVGFGAYSPSVQNVDFLTTAINFGYKIEGSGTTIVLEGFRDDNTSTNVTAAAFDAGDMALRLGGHYYV
jgi:hypothetical protein